MKAVFEITELRAIVEAAYHAEKNGEPYDWSKYCLATEEGMAGYDKYFEYLSDREQDFFEECLDVALGDVRDDLAILEDNTTAPELKYRSSILINGWIEAAFEEFLQ